jgi:lytic murein transglycosylase
MEYEAVNAGWSERAPGRGSLVAIAAGWAIAALPAAAFWAATAGGATAHPPEKFRSFIEELWPEAQAKGVSRTTFDSAFAGVEPDLTLPDLILADKTERDVKGQAEFTKTPSEYVDSAYLARLATQGRALAAKHSATLDRIEKQIGVPRQFVLAIWGRETAFGEHKATHYAIQALATQAYLGRRKELFRGELVYALKMLEDGILQRATMKSSWGGAMGLTQFLPSQYYTLAYDLDGDGRKDIWSSVPDALASAANQLRDRGWINGQPWAYEVRLPAGVTCQLEGPPHARTLREWKNLGVTRAQSRAFPDHLLDAEAFLLTPGGAHGPAFLAFENFMVIKRYNMSDLYAVFVGNLADRIAGGGTFERSWGGVVQLSAPGIADIQQRLQARGYAISKIDGKAGMNTRALVGAYQKANSLNVDCWPSRSVLSHLRNGAMRKRALPGDKSSLGAQ